MLQAQREGVEIVICDTSGRLHTNVGLWAYAACMHQQQRCPALVIWQGLHDTKRMASAPDEGAAGAEWKHRWCIEASDAMNS